MLSFSLHNYLIELLAASLNSRDFGFYSFLCAIETRRRWRRFSAQGATGLPQAILSQSLDGFGLYHLSDDISVTDNQALPSSLEKIREIAIESGHGDKGIIPTAVAYPPNQPQHDPNTQTFYPSFLSIEFLQSLHYTGADDGLYPSVIRPILCRGEAAGGVTFRQDPDCDYDEIDELMRRTIIAAAEAGKQFWDHDVITNIVSQFNDEVTTAVEGLERMFPGTKSA